MTGEPVPVSIPGSITLRSSDGTVNVTVNTNRVGGFIASVAPGIYTVTGQSTQLQWPVGSCHADSAVTVTDKGTSGVKVRCPGQ